MGCTPRLVAAGAATPHLCLRIFHVCVSTLQCEAWGGAISKPQLHTGSVYYVYFFEQLCWQVALVNAICVLLHELLAITPSENTDFISRWQNAFRQKPVASHNQHSDDIPCHGMAWQQAAGRSVPFPKKSVDERRFATVELANNYQQEQVIKIDYSILQKFDLFDSWANLQIAKQTPKSPTALGLPTPACNLSQLTVAGFDTNMKRCTAA